LADKDDTGAGRQNTRHCAMLPAMRTKEGVDCRFGLKKLIIALIIIFVIFPIIVRCM